MTAAEGLDTLRRMLPPETLRALLFWCAVTLVAIAQGALLVRSIRASAPSSASPLRGRFGRAGELAMVALPALLLVLLLVLTWRATRAATY